MGKFDRELMAYGKASGAFEYAAKRCAEDVQNPRLRQEVASEFNYLEKVAYPPIENAYKQNPNDKDAQHAFEIATRDLMLMRNKLHSL